MRKLAIYLSVCLSLPLWTNAQTGSDCDCVHPIVFVHGWAGNGGSWSDIYEHPDFVSIYGSFDANTQTYHAVLNATTETQIFGGNINDYPSYVDDDVIVHEQFTNAPVLAPNKCVYVINWENYWNEDPSSPEIDIGSGGSPGLFSSDSNESAIVKSGYALSKAIQRVLSLTGKEKVVLVTHSMGGLMAREYLQRRTPESPTGTPRWWVFPAEADGHRVAKLFTAGTPHGGSNTGDFVPLFGFLNFDLNSEAVRDLRYSHDLATQSIPGVYLFGGAESDIPIYDPAFWNHDVNCDGDEVDLNITGISQTLGGLQDNVQLPLPTGPIKYTYYVSDQLAIGCAGTSQNSDGIVFADRQWLYDGGSGSTNDFNSGLSTPIPFSQEAHFQSDRITTPNASAHTSSLNFHCATTTNETADIDQIMRGLDEGDYPFFATEVLPNTPYAGLANLRADRVPASSEYTGNATNTLDGDWYKVVLSEPVAELRIRIDVPDNIDLVTRVDLFAGSPTSLYANDEPGITHLTQHVDESGPDSLRMLACELPPVGQPIYFRISNSLHNLADPATAWRHPYKFSVVTTPALYLDGSCPTAPDCVYTFAAYGDSGCDYDCTNRYDGSFGNLRLPIHFVTAGDNVQTTEAQLDQQLADINLWLHNVANLPWSFYRASSTRLPGSQYNDWYTLTDGSPPMLAVFDEVLNNPNSITLIAVDSMNGAAAGYPLGNPPPGLNDSHWVITDQDHINDNQWPVTIHEMGHVFGLHHTFECQAFPPYNLCDAACREGDGMADTPFDRAPYDIGEVDPNFMSYDTLSWTSIPEFFPNITATDCQAAKMNDLLFHCRNYLGLPLETPDIRHFADDLPASTIQAPYNDPLPTVYAHLNGLHYSNDDGFAHWQFTRPNGTTFELWADTLDLNTLYTTTQINTPGTYLVEVKDKRYYNLSSASTPATFTLELAECNLNDICEPWEITTDCIDCEIGGIPVSLQRIEYFIDSDPGLGQATPVMGVSGSQVDISFTVDMSSFSPGIHTLYVRAQDMNGRWSFVQQRIFYLLNSPVSGAELSYLEYFLDEDPGPGQATPLALADPTNSQSDYTIDLSSLAPGIHTLYVRAKDNRGRWSFVQRKIFYLFDSPASGTELNYLEYFLNDDPGAGMATPLTLADPIDSQSDYSIDLSALTPGIYTLYVRARDDHGRWSFVQRRVFYLFNDPVPGDDTELSYLEYFLNDDPGLGNATPLALVDPIDSQSDYSIDLSALTPGIHTLYVRARDDHGRWSFVQRRVFYLFNDPVPGDDTELSYLEYFLNDDPGLGNATPLALVDPIDSQSDYSIDLSALIPGIHTLYVRARDDRGRWSFVQRRVFYVYTSPDTGPLEITEIEYFIDGPAPPLGEATPLSFVPDDSVSVDFTIDPDGLNGNHYLYARARDSYGRWSFMVRDTLIWSDLGITILYPNGGEIFTAGNDAISGIDWEAIGSVGLVDIWLLRANGTPVTQIAENVDQDGPWAGSWPIPTWINAGQYRIRVSAASEPTILGYSTNTFTINSPDGGYCDGFTDLVEPSEARDAATCLCDLGYVTPKYYSPTNTYGVNAAGNIERADLAKLAYYLIYRGDAETPAANFPVPFADLQNASTTYFKYAKALSYLQYQDPVTPFDRDFINFRPFDGITGKYVLKVILETMDIAPDNTGPSPYPNIEVGDDAYGYVKEAHDRGWLPDDFDPQALARHSVVFVILKRILDDGGEDCNPNNPVLPPAPTLADYFVPGNFTPFNQARSVDLAEGYFPSFFKSSFRFPGIGLPLVFGHGYYAHHAEQPAIFRPLTPLGRSWSHTFNTYIIEEIGWSTEQGAFADKLFVNWGDGSLHCYDKASLTAETQGVFSDLTQVSEVRYEIKSKAQVVYGFTRYLLDDTSGRYVWMLTDISDRNGNRITITIDDSGTQPRVQSVLGNGGYRLDFAYGTNDKLTTVTDVVGSRIIHYTVDGDNNLAAYTNAKGDVSTFSYGTTPTDHLLYGVQLPEGNGITNTYGADGRLASSRINGQSAATQVAAVYDYTQTTTPLVSTVTDTDGNVTTKTYNSEGYLSQYSQAGDDLTIVYDADHPSLPASVTSNGNTVGTTYDSQGNPLTITLPLGVVHRYTYNGNNDPLTYTNPRGKVTRFTYDDNGNLDAVTDPNNHVTDMNFNGQGQLRWIESSEGVRFTNNYNPDGTLAGTTGPEGLYQNFGYDAVGRRVSAENANGQVTTFAHDVLDQMVRMTRESAAGDIVTNYRFTPNMLLDSIINAHGNATTFDYNDQNQPTKIQFGDDADLIAYDEEGKVDFTTVPTGDVLDRTYDDRDRLTFNGYATLTYDDRDNPETFTHAGRTTVITYDALDRPRTATYDGRTVGFDYDLNGNSTSQTYADGTLITRIFDDADRLDEIRLGSSVLVSYTYRDDNLPSRIDYGNGTYCLFTYDNAARLTGKAWHKSGGTPICTYDITLDGLGNHLSVDASEPFGHPALAPAMYDGIYNDENEPISVDGQTYTFNALGVQTNDGQRAFTWNEHEQLLSIDGVLNYEYDGQKLRRSRSTPDGAWTYDWDVRGIGNVLTDYLDGTARYHYVYGTDLACRIDVATGDISYFHGDTRGSVVAITEANQQITHQYQYDPFGVVLRTTEADFNPFQFVGQYGLMYEGHDIYYVRARYMDARQGRFLSEDPVWANNLYPYAGNNPIKFIDMNGRQFSRPNDYTDQAVIGNNSFVPVDQALRTLRTTIDWSAGWRNVKAAVLNMLDYNDTSAEEIQVVAYQKETDQEAVIFPNQQDQFREYFELRDRIDILKEEERYWEFRMVEARQSGQREKVQEYGIYRRKTKDVILLLEMEAKRVKPRL